MTSFRNTKVERRFTPDRAAMDVSSVNWIEPVRAALVKATPEGIACGNSDVSQLAPIIYVSNQGNDVANCGTKPANSCKTVAYGVSRCGASGCNVLVMFDEYQLSTTLTLSSASMPKGGRLYGGCLPEGQAGPDYRSVLLAPAGGMSAVSVDKITAVDMENFKLVGSAAAGNQGAPTMTLTVTNGGGLTLVNSELIGGAGAPGAPGANASPGSPGGNASGQTAGTTSGCSSTQGGTGAGQMGVDNRYTECVAICGSDNCLGGWGAPGDTVNWASYGQAGTGAAYFCPPITPNGGGEGGAGSDAGCGAGGLASTNANGSFAGSTWTGTSGQNGTRGLNGGGGGGGGSGGFACGICFLVPWSYNGSSGGGGGAGGCGGSPGGGGQQGGGSFVAVVVSSSLTLNQTRVIAGRSGDGGAGGPSGAGGIGGTHADGAGSNSLGYHGGKGGAGGDGGAGGGAGGNGGPAIGIALVGNSSITGSGIVYYPGSSGNVGTGSSGAKSGSAKCTGGRGANGNPGLEANTHQY
jgi:hypothetical protein